MKQLKSAPGESLNEYQVALGRGFLKTIKANKRQIRAKQLLRTEIVIAREVINHNVYEFETQEEISGAFGEHCSLKFTPKQEIAVKKGVNESHAELKDLLLDCTV